MKYECPMCGNLWDERPEFRQWWAYNRDIPEQWYRKGVLMCDECWYYKVGHGTLGLMPRGTAITRGVPNGD